MDHVNVRRAVSKISRKNIAKKTTEFMSVIEILISIQQGISEKMFEFFFKITQYNSDTHNTRTLTPMS